MDDQGWVPIKLIASFKKVSLVENNLSFLISFGDAFFCINLHQSIHDMLFAITVGRIEVWAIVTTSFNTSVLSWLYVTSTDR